MLYIRESHFRGKFQNFAKAAWQGCTSAFPRAAEVQGTRGGPRLYLSQMQPQGPAPFPAGRVNGTGTQTMRSRVCVQEMKLDVN